MIGENHEMPIFVRAPNPGNRQWASSFTIHASAIDEIKRREEFARKLDGNVCFPADAVYVFRLRDHEQDDV